MRKIFLTCLTFFIFYCSQTASYPNELNPTQNLEISPSWSFMRDENLINPQIINKKTPAKKFFEYADKTFTTQNPPICTEEMNRYKQCNSK